MSIEKHLLLGYKKDLPEDIAKTIADYLMEKQEQKEDSVEDRLMEIFFQQEYSYIIQAIQSQMTGFQYSRYEDAIGYTFEGLKKNGQIQWITDLMMRRPFTFKQYLKLYSNDKEMINNFIRYMIHCQYYHWSMHDQPA